MVCALNGRVHADSPCRLDDRPGRQPFAGRDTRRGARVVVVDVLADRLDDLQGDLAGGACPVFRLACFWPSGLCVRRGVAVDGDDAEVDAIELRLLHAEHRLRRHAELTLVIEQLFHPIEGAIRRCPWQSRGHRPAPPGAPRGGCWLPRRRSWSWSLRQRRTPSEV